MDLTTSAPAADAVSLATCQRSLGDPDVTYPLWPPLTSGCPRTSTEEIACPVEVDYAYDQAPRGLFSPGASPSRSAGLDRWAPLLPPLDVPGLGEGGTPLVELEPGVWMKDESRNPTWSHKDRYNRVAVSAAARLGAPGVVVASSGNHGASAAAYAARAGLRCVVFTGEDLPPAVDAFLHAYGAVVLPVPVAARWPLVRRVVEEFGLHPVSNLTLTHTGHAFGPEGYKTIAYEIHADVGIPAAVFAPTGYAELLFGVWKGFTELRRLGVTDRVPVMYACEPAAGGPLARALRDGVPAAHVDVGPTDAYGIACSVGGYRGVVAVRESGGRVVLVDNEQLTAAQAELARTGLWAELSAAAGLAGLRALRAMGSSPDLGGPVVCVSTSSGFKDRAVGSGGSTARAGEQVGPEWPEVYQRLRAAGIGDRPGHRSPSCTKDR
ncbi:threonine synthase [Actinopolymorpha singaporensis]|uniref:threonine synthase n=1 Tax=Actinopolymorpha singaporensis TaxID=117157 RepID=UPI001F522D27|nr:pyridoxal-phosphate dependent enzyme [Actinopolymorpha singaporensis]